MMKQFFNNLADSWLAYLLVLMNIFHAIQTGEYDWLLWLSSGLAVLSIILCFLRALRDGTDDA